MCDEISRGVALHSHVRKALESVDREMFVPEFMRHLAYSLKPLPMEAAQWVSSPLTVAKMTQYLTPGDSVLEIGCGSGYQAMVLSRIFRRVFSIERIESLLLEARDRIRASGVSNILQALIPPNLKASNISSALLSVAEDCVMRRFWRNVCLSRWLVGLPSRAQDGVRVMKSTKAKHTA